MVDPSCEVDPRWPEGVLSWKLDIEEEDSAFVGTAIRADHCCLPIEQIIFINWASTDIVDRIAAQIFQFFLNPLESHLYDYSLHFPCI